MEKILEKLKEIWAKIVDWWNSFTSKQKTIIVVIACFVVLAFAGLIALLSNPNYTVIKTATDTAEASQIVAVLDENGIKHKESDDGLRIQVPRKSLSAANLALGSSGITSDDYSIEAALKGGFTVTEADKQKKYKEYMEKSLAEDFLAYFTPIKSAKVRIGLAENDGTLLSTKEETTVAVTLQIEGDFTKENAESLAKSIAGALRLDNTDGITILDTDANILFSGSDDDSISGNASSQLGVKAEAESLMNSKVKSVLAGTGQFGDVKVSTNLDMDFSSTTETSHQYTPADGQSQGLLATDKNYTSDSSGGTSGVPGTDSNTETTYQYQDNSYNSSTIEEYYRTYLPNENIMNKEIPPGRILYDNSSVAVSSIDYVVIKEEDAKAAGLLDGITWREYQEANSERKKLTVPEEMITLVANATGISPDKVNIVAYEENLFIDKEGMNVDVTDVVQIVLILLILALLAVVVIKSMRTEKEAEEPEQLSVEGLLQSNPEPQLDDIELEEASETRRLIEKFVDENPEAVANLLRNWLNEDWG